MRLAEALMRRADLTKRLTQLRQRAVTNATRQEGDEPAEDPTELVTEHDELAIELERLIRRINATNIETAVESARTLTDALAHRDVLRLRHRLRSELADAGIPGRDRWTRSEVKQVASVDIRALRGEADGLAAELRQLDTRIQELNWTTELNE